MPVLELLTTPPDVSPWHGGGGPRSFLQQPAVPGLAGLFYVPPAQGTAPPPGRFTFTLWQPNPMQPDGLLSPVSWPVGDLTGFYPSEPLAAQQGFAPAAGVSAVQAEGGTVGAYINSRDLIHGSPNSKMMAAPGLHLSPGTGPFPYRGQAGAVRAMLALQVPTATTASAPKSFAYASLDIQFVDDTTGAAISYGTALFSQARHYVSHIGIDPVTRNMMINALLDPENPWLVCEPATTLHQATPWRGFRPFAYAIPADRFAAALAAMRAAHPDFQASPDPADYRLQSVHLNAELQFAGGAASLGWSMQGLEVSLT